jgi:hypothetical protein
MSRTSWKSTGARAVLPGLIALAAALLFQCQPFALRNILDGASRSSLTISPSTMIIPVNKVVSFTASGGVAPYTFSLVSGVGQLTDPVAGTYDALGVPGSAVIRVTDKAGKTVDAQITVESAGVSIGISPSAITVKVNTTVTFTAFGGSVPYSFSVFSGGGTINSATGVYTVPSVAGSAIVRVTDFGGGTADSAVTIDATGQTLALSPSSIQLAASSDATFAAVGGVPPYTYSILSAGSGSPAINSGTGFYTAGVNPGVDTVEVRDSAVPIAGSATASVTVVTLATNVDYRVPSTSLVGSATVGASGVAGGSFVVSNNGTGSGTLTVFWKVYLSVNNQLDGGDTIVASGSTAALAAGASAPVSPTVSLPVVTPGSYYLIAEVEALDDLVTNNNAGAASPLTLGPQNINYDVPSPVSPGSGTIAGQAMTGSFKVHNGGTASGLASVNWRAYASADATLDAGDYLLAAGSTAALPAGITSGSIGFSGIWPTSPGTYYLIVSVSADDEPAGNAGNNWTASAPVTITGAPPANVDYIVAAVNLPSPTTAGKPFTATFTYKNQGSAAGSQDVFWTAYLSADTTLQLGTDLVVDSGKIVGGALPANTGSGPVGFGGTWPAVPATAYLIVIVYAPEDIAPANNSLTGSAVTTTAPNINYKVLSVSNSTGTVAGDSFTEDLTVQNYGADGGASDAYWTAYLSLDGTLDAGDQMIDWGTITGGLASGASSALISFKGTRPAAANTTYWLIVKVSASDEPAGNAGDNWKASSSATTTAPDVDYAPNTPGSPAVVTAGAAFSGTFTITNSGGHDGTQSVPWRIYVSSDAVWDAGDQIADSGVIASPGLAKGATSAALSFNGVWPASLTPQTYYLIAKTFAGDDIAAGNNEKASAAIVVNPLNVNYAVSNPTVPAGALAGAPLAQSFTFQ